MLLLITFALVALGFSFLCSIAEAVLLSTTSGYIAMLEQEGKPAGRLLRTLKENINQPLAAILTLNTIAHTVGAAGVGAQSTVLYGSTALGIASAVMTLLILVLSEIIPKTMGANYWQALAPATAHFARILIWSLYPFVKLSEYLTRTMVNGPGLKGFNREELAALAELGWQEGLLAGKEARIMTSLLSLHETRVSDAMTPKTVIFSIPETYTVGDYYRQYGTEPFSRIPVYKDHSEDITGFVLRDDLLLALARGEMDTPVSTFRRDMSTTLSELPLLDVFDHLLRERIHIMLVVDEYGGVQGILTLEDVLETILGLEIIDESDTVTNMQELARRFWRRHTRTRVLVQGQTEKPPEIKQNQQRD